MNQPKQLRMRVVGNNIESQKVERKHILENLVLYSRQLY